MICMALFTDTQACLFAQERKVNERRSQGTSYIRCYYEPVGLLRRSAMLVGRILRRGLSSKRSAINAPIDFAKTCALICPPGNIE